MHAFKLRGDFFTLMLMNGIGTWRRRCRPHRAIIGTFRWARIAVLTAFGVNPEVATGLYAGAARRFVLQLPYSVPTTWCTRSALGGFCQGRKTERR